MSPVADTATAAAGSTKQLHARDSKPITTLTTPFVPATSCHDAFLPTTTITQFLYTSSPTTVWELQVASTAGCQPSGTEYQSDRWLYFSPAVCPSGWTAYEMRASSTYKMKMASVEFYASCCTSGFNLTNIYAPPAASGGGVCSQQVSPPVTTITAGQTIISQAARIHEPWVVAWKAKDTSSLSPAPPALSPTCTNIQLPSWVPGSPAPAMTAPCYEAQKEENWGGGVSSGLIFFVMIGLPMIGVACIAACITCCVCSASRDKARRRKELALGQQQPADEQLPVDEQLPTDEQPPAYTMG